MGLHVLKTHCKHGHEYTPENTILEKKTGFRICRTCRERYTEGWKNRNTTKRAAVWRKWHLKKRFGLTPETYDKMLLEQGGRCAICRSSETKTKTSNRFSIDHDHSTGVVRGLLCNHCNVAIGMAENSPVTLRLIADYLER